MTLSSNAEEIVQKRYYAEDDYQWQDHWEGLSKRVGYAVAANETEKERWGETFATEIYDMNFLPGGRILRNAGRIRPTMMNCACLPIGDSIEEIGETIKNSLILWSYGAGIGIDFSPLRPEGRPLVSKGGKSSGMVSFLKSIDSVAGTIETGGQRRSGCLALCRVGHPEIRKFINAKLKDKELSYFNLSVGVNTDFLRAVEQGDGWDLQFAGQVSETVDAMELWRWILEGMIKSGDPGLINMDNLMKNNSYYFQKISATNLCGELPLPDYGMCDLGSIVLKNMVTPGGSTNWLKLKATVYHAVRFLDNVLDVNFFPITECERITKESRRIGLGVMGLHDYLMAKGLRYGADQEDEYDCGPEIIKLFKNIRNYTYQASIELAMEKGAFPGYSKSLFNAASFIRGLPPTMRQDIKRHGVRNCTALSAQPTGTTSLVADCSSGIEPIFATAYMRKDRVSDRVYIHEKLKEHLQTGKKRKPKWLVDSYDITPKDHLEVQRIVQKYMDNATSKTINCPHDMTIDKLSDLLLEYTYDLKGVTVYVDQSKSGQVLNKLSWEEARQHLEEESVRSEEEIQCAKGSCDV